MLQDFYTYIMPWIVLLGTPFLTLFVLKKAGLFNYKLTRKQKTDFLKEEEIKELREENMLAKFKDIVTEVVRDEVKVVREEVKEVRSEIQKNREAINRIGTKLGLEEPKE